MADDNKTYLGDGLYGEFDGHGVRLATIRWQDGQDVTHWVYLEPEVLEQFMLWIEKLRVKATQAR
jgi:hypothetical protein